MGGPLRTDTEIGKRDKNRQTDRQTVRQTETEEKEKEKELTTDGRPSEDRLLREAAAEKKRAIHISHMAMFGL